MENCVYFLFLCSSIRSRVRGQLWIYLAFVPSDEDTEEEAQSEQVPSAPDEVYNQGLRLYDFFHAQLS